MRKGSAPHRAASASTGPNPRASRPSEIGYLLGDDGAGSLVLVAKEGELRLACSNGIACTLLLGEVLYDDCDEISADEGAKETDAEVIGLSDSRRRVRSQADPL